MKKSGLKRTPLAQVHVAMGARMVEFAGWEMPVEYGGVIEEHMAVRERAGLFDLSHMGEIEVSGPRALELIQLLTPNDAARLAVGQAQYSALTTEQGTFVDDLLIYRTADQSFFLCVNAANTEKDYAWISERRFATVEVKDLSSEYALIAIQGPRAEAILSRLTRLELSAIKYYWFARGEVGGVLAMVSRTGYTGEDGFELFVPAEDAEKLWNEILAAGGPDGLLPAGLGARNTLRLEAKMLLYGNDIDETTTVLEADLGWMVKFDKGEFLGREALYRQKQQGVERLLVGFEVTGRGIAREHYPVFIGGRKVGRVTSGSMAPYLKKNIGLTYLPVEHARAGTPLEIEIRGRFVPAVVVPTPFYRRKKN